MASLAANVAVAEPTATGRVYAAWPSFALIAAYELLMRQVLRSAAVGGTRQHSKPGPRISCLERDETAEHQRRETAVQHPTPNAETAGAGGQGVSCHFGGCKTNACAVLNAFGLRGKAGLDYAPHSGEPSLAGRV